LSGRFRQPLDYWTGEVYRRVKLALITGWPMEYIDDLGYFDYESILQIHEAENYVEEKAHGNSGRVTIR